MKRISGSKLFFGASSCLIGIALVLSSCSPSAATPSPSIPETQPSVAQPTNTVEPTAAPTSEPTSVPTIEPTTEVISEGPQGTLTYGAGQDPEFLDPTMSLQFYNYMISYTMFDTLVRVNDEGQVVPSLAESWELVSPTSWKFNLRQDVMFHDGTPFTSASVKATLDHIVDPDVQARQAALWVDYDYTETPDDYTAIIHTKEPMGTLLPDLGITFMIPPDPATPLLEHPVGTGPFKFVEWIKDDHLTVEANPDYWDGAPNLAKVIFRNIPDVSTRVSALAQGEIDMMDLVPAEEFSNLEEAGIQIIHQPTFNVVQLWLGNDGPLADVRVRQAINLAIDRESITQDLLEGQGVPSTGCLAPGVIGYNQMSPLEYDPEQAKALLNDAGFESGFDLEIKFPIGLYTKGKEVNQVIAAQLNEIGIRAKVVDQDQAVWVQDLIALTWQANTILSGTVTGDADYASRRLFLSDNNRIPYKNPELDNFLNAQARETDPEIRLQDLKDACQIMWDEVPVVFLYVVVDDYGVSPRVHNVQTHPSTIVFFKDVSVD